MEVKLFHDRPGKDHDSLCCSWITVHDFYSESSTQVLQLKNKNVVLSYSWFEYIAE
jgi:hypothetical protein